MSSYEIHTTVLLIQNAVIPFQHTSFTSLGLDSALIFLSPIKNETPSGVQSKNETAASFFSATNSPYNGSRLTTPVWCIGSNGQLSATCKIMGGPAASSHSPAGQAIEGNFPPLPAFEPTRFGWIGNRGPHFIVIFPTNVIVLIPPVVPTFCKLFSARQISPKWKWCRH